MFHPKFSCSRDLHVMFLCNFAILIMNLIGVAEVVSTVSS